MSGPPNPRLPVQEFQSLIQLLDLIQNAVREVAMATGLVDFKVSAIDETWSGFRFSRARNQ